MSGGSKKTTQETKVDPGLMSLYNQNYQSASGIANQPFQPYTGEMVAPANPMQNQAFGMFGNIANNNTGAATLNSGIGATQGVAGFQPNNVTAGNLPGTDLSGYMNPFQKNVTDATMSDLERQRQIAANSDTQRAQAAGAYGGSRSGVAQSLTNEAAGRTAASTLAGLNFGNFQNAQTAATGDLNRRLSADQGNQNAGIAGAGLRLNAGSQLGAMSGQELNQALMRAGAVGGAGDQQRSIQQQQNDAAMSEFMRKLNYPIQGQQIKNQALGMIPQQTSTTGTTTTTPSAMGMAGSAMEALGPLAMMFAFSDRRLKSDITPSHSDARGRKWVTFRYLWDAMGVKRLGVIAQDILKTDPDAVRTHKSGYLMVDYAKLGDA